MQEPKTIPIIKVQTYDPVHYLGEQPVCAYAASTVFQTLEVVLEGHDITWLQNLETVEITDRICGRCLSKKEPVPQCPMFRDTSTLPPSQDPSFHTCEIVMQQRIKRLSQLPKTLLQMAEKLQELILACKECDTTFMGSFCKSCPHLIQAKEMWTI